MNISFSEKDLSGGSYIPEGEHVVTVAEVKQETSKAGAPMIVVILKDRMGREAKEYFTLADNAKWKLAGFAKACGISKDVLQSQGLNIASLMGKKAMMVKKQSGVEMYQGKEKKTYDVEFFHVGEGTQAQSANSEDIPF